MIGNQGKIRTISSSQGRVAKDSRSNAKKSIQSTKPKSNRSSLLTYFQIVVILIFGLLVYFIEQKFSHFDTQMLSKLTKQRTNQSPPSKDVSIVGTIPTLSNSNNNIFANEEKTIISQRSKYAYVTLLSGIDTSYKYRGFFYNTLIMKKVLKEMGSTADFIVMIGFSDSTADSTFFNEDKTILESFGIIIHELPRLVDDTHKLSFAEMALLKITPLSLTTYDKIQFLDGDIMPTKNMDCFFELTHNSYTIGAASPLNSGWFLIYPNQDIYDQLKKLAQWRLARDWDEKSGWGNEMPQNNLYFRGGKKYINEWQFNGCDMDQGLYLHHYVLNNGNAILIDTDTKVVRYFEKGLLTATDHQLDMEDELKSCNGQEPTSYFVHFTGRSKPWIKAEDKVKYSKGSLTDLWFQKLESLDLNVTAASLASSNLGSPLGYFNANFPKGGFKVKT